MGNLIAIEHLTLDGVVQGPGRPDEDTRGGFDRGGWGLPGNDGVMGEALGRIMGGVGALLFGRRTYQDFHGFWAGQDPDSNPFTTALNNYQKYVVTSTLREPLPWQNSTLLEGPLEDSVATLKKQSDKDIAIFGCAQLVRSLMPSGLIDTYLLMIHPIVLGSGARLFPSDGPSADLRLVDSTATSKGVLIGTYQPR